MSVCQYFILTFVICIEPYLGSLRLSIDEETSDEDIDYILEVVPIVVKRLREMSPVWEEMVKADPSLKY